MSATKKYNTAARIYPAYKPKAGETSVLYWDGSNWEACPSDALTDFDVWCSEPKPPSARLQARAKAKATG